MTIGIYKITCLINNKSYVGQSMNCEKRSIQHFRKSSAKELDQDIKKYGASSFKFEILVSFHKNPGQKILDQMEVWCIDTEQSLSPSGYNKHRVGKGSLLNEDHVYQEWLKNKSISETSKIIGCSRGQVKGIVSKFIQNQI